MSEPHVTREDAKRHMRVITMMGHAMHRNILAMQAAYIEWRHGGGAEAAMQWIGNTLDGPGLIPEDTEKDAQAYFDREAEAEDKRMDAILSEDGKP